jgi:methyltransferase (TIGR00027 family)
LDWPAGTVVFELDQPEVLAFKRAVLAEAGARPSAGRREVGVDLREDWPQALRDSGFDPAKPSAWLAEGIMLYLPGWAQEQLCAGIDSLAASGSHVALEERQPMPDEALEAKRAEERAQSELPGKFFGLIYNEKHRDAVDWFEEHGWDAEAVLAADYVREGGRPVPPPDTDGGQLLRAGNLVAAKKR